VLPHARTDVSSQGIDIVVLLDLSSSMQEEIGRTPQQRATITDAIKRLQGDVLDVQWDMQQAGQQLTELLRGPQVDADAALAQVDRIFELEQTVERTATDTVGQRLADLLLRVARRDDGRLEVRGVAQADLAKMIGASRESVSRQIAAWEREGILRGGQRRVQIIDETRLTERARSV